MQVADKEHPNKVIARQIVEHWNKLMSEELGTDKSYNQSLNSRESMGS